MTGRNDGTLESFKRSLPLADIVGRYVKLTRRGREHQGLCPFHQEKTPSFSVVEEKGFYHCFGCGAHGNAIDFIMAVEGLPFADALKRVSDLAGIEPPRLQSTQTPKIDPGLVDANAAAARYFVEMLHSSAGNNARGYLSERGLSRDAIAQFGLGFAPSGRGELGQWLDERGIGEAIAVESGLLIRPDDGRGCYSRFRDRLMIPIEDQRGRIVGFGGRALAGQQAKYLNSPETPLFHKGSLLYNLKNASVSARRNDRLIVVEGYMDVIALAEAGFTEAVAPLGTAVTEDQLQLMWRGCPTPVVCLDGDRAGQAAALRMARRALPVMQSGQSLNFVLLPEGEDPDSLVRSRGAQALEGLMRTALPLSRLVWQHELSASPAETPEQLAALRKRLFEHVDSAGDPNLRSALRDQFIALLDARRPRNPRFQQRLSPRDKRDRGRWEVSARLGAVTQTSESMRDIRLIAWMLLDPELLERHDERLAEIELSDAAAETARQEALSWYAGTVALDGHDLRNHLTSHGCEKVVVSADRVLRDLKDTEFDRTEMDRAVIALCDRAAQARGRDELAVGVSTGDPERFDAMRRAFDDLLNPGIGLKPSDD